MDDETVDRVAALFSALGNSVRVRIVMEIIAEPLHVGAISERLNLGQSNTSQHLAVLERVGLIKATKAGASRIYQVRGPRIPKLLEIIQEFCEIHGLTGMPTVVTEAENG